MITCINNDQNSKCEVISSVVDYIDDCEHKASYQAQDGKDHKYNFQTCKVI
jgi:hypothetical protein